MDLNDDAWTVVKNTPGVTGFVGAGDEARAALPARGRPDPPHGGGRRRAPARPGRVLARRVGQGHLRPALRLRRRDRRGQRRRSRSSRCSSTSSSARCRSSSASTRSRRSRLRTQPDDPMAKKVLTLIKLQIPGGQANPAPPVGPALGQHGVNIMEFCKAFNAQTAARERPHHPGRDHGLRGPLVHLHHEDAAGRRPDQGGARHREGLGRAEPRQGRHAHRGAGARRSPRRRCPT